jgi:hypothetical protein
MLAGINLFDGELMSLTVVYSLSVADDCGMAAQFGLHERHHCTAMYSCRSCFSYDFHFHDRRNAHIVLKRPLSMKKLAVKKKGIHTSLRLFETDNS